MLYPAMHGWVVTIDEAARLSLTDLYAREPDLLFGRLREDSRRGTYLVAIGRVGPGKAGEPIPEQWWAERPYVHDTTAHRVLLEGDPRPRRIVSWQPNKGRIEVTFEFDDPASPSAA